MKRVRIDQLARETGLSRATIDRALNGRGGVHERTKRVIEETLLRLSAHEATPEAATAAGSAGEPGVDLVLRVGRGLLEQIKAARNALGHQSMSIHDMYQRNEHDLLDQVRELCRDPSRPLILTAKDAEPLRAELVNARKRGKRVITLVSDLSHDARDAFVGID